METPSFDQATSSFAKRCFLFAWIDKEPFPEPGKPIRRQVSFFGVIKAEALKGKTYFRGKIKLLNLKRAFFIYPANWVPKMVIFWSEGLIAVIISSSVPEILLGMLSYPALKRVISTEVEKSFSSSSFVGLTSMFFKKRAW